MSAPGSQGGLFGSLRQLAGTAVEMAHVRLRILGTELEEEKLRLFDGLLLAALGLVMVSVGAVLLCILILLLFAEGYRLAALSVMTLSFIAGGVLTMRAGGQKLRGDGHMFKATLGELAQDHSALQPRE
jgi:uncharacterized membrane protein YqjE